MTFSELMFYAEAEGILPTRAGKINAIINTINKLPYSIDNSEFDEILEEYGFQYGDLTERELRYIAANID